MKVRGLAIILCLLIFTLMFTGCKSKEVKEADSEKVEVQETEDDEKNDEEAEKEDEEIDEEEVDEEETDEKEIDNDESSKDVTVKEQVLFEHNGVAITAIKFVTDDAMGDGIELLIENDSDVRVQVGCNGLIVNDYTTGSLFNAIVSPGEKVHKVMYLYNQKIKAAGIRNVGQIEVYFFVLDTETNKEPYETDSIIIKTSKYENMDTKLDNKGTMIYDADGIEIYGQIVKDNSFFGDNAILIYCENNSGKNIRFGITELYINGSKVGNNFAPIVYDGKKSIEPVTIISKDLESNGISSFEEIEVKFGISDLETHKEIAESELIKLPVK